MAKTVNTAQTVNALGESQAVQSPAGLPQALRPTPAQLKKRTLTNLYNARPAWLDSRGAALRTETYETARLRFPGYDIYFVEGEWRSWASGKPPAEDADRAFLAFFRKFSEANPL